MSQYDNTNTGAVFKNDRKTEDRQPDYNGNVNADGKEYKLAGWIRESKKTGKKFISLKLTPAEPRGEESQVPPLDSETPF